MTDRYLIFTGCSFTAGGGWNDVEDTKTHPHLWTNLCCRNIDRFQNLTVLNHAQNGCSNTDIFEQAVSSLVEFGKDIDTLMCQWTAMPRYQWKVGFELWDTSEHVTSYDVEKHDVHLSDGTVYPRKYIIDIKTRFRAMHHLHWEILKVVRYSKILENLAAKIGSKILFVNGICPWDKHYFTRLENVEPEDYTEFTKTQILDIDSRSDEDILKLYNLAHDQYIHAGGINHSLWINLYNSFRDTQIDYNHDGMHPGKNSNKLYSQLIADHFQSL